MQSRWYNQQTRAGRKESSLNDLWYVALCGGDEWRIKYYHEYNINRKTTEGDNNRIINTAMHGLTAYLKGAKYKEHCDN